MEEQIKIDYIKYKNLYKKFQEEIFNFINKIIDSEEYGNVDIVEIKERPGGQIKQLESILKNLARSDKYNGYSSIFNIKDIAGVKVICHCEDDLSAFAEIIENKLNEGEYLDVKREDKGGSNNAKTESQKNRPSYRAVHITVAQNFTGIDNQKIKIYCEIQLRTVMGDAWAIQDRKYRYGDNIVEGDRNILTDSVSEIMMGCEGLWSLVKKKYKDGLDIKPREFKSITKHIEDKIKILKQQDTNKFDFDLKKDNL